MENLDFDKFFADRRAGDEEAAAELVRRYEPYLRHVLDSVTVSTAASSVPEPGS